MANNTDWLTVSPMSGDSGTTTLSLTALTNNTLSAKTAVISGHNDTYGVTGTTTVTLKAFEPTLTLSRSTLRFDSTGGTGTFTVYSNTAWTITYPSLVYSYSVSAGTGDTEVTIALAPNTTLVSKIDTGIVKDVFNVNQLQLTIVQEAFINELTLTPDDDIVFANTGSSTSVTIESNCDWEIELPDWVSASTTTGESGTTVVTFTAGQNDDADRSGEIIIYYGSKEIVINASQPLYVEPYLTVTPSSYAFPYTAFERVFTVDSYPEWSAEIISTGETVFSGETYCVAIFNVPSATTISFGYKGDTINTYLNGVVQYGNSGYCPTSGTYKVVYTLPSGGTPPIVNDPYLVDFQTYGDVGEQNEYYVIVDYYVTSGNDTHLYNCPMGYDVLTPELSAITLEDGTDITNSIRGLDNYKVYNFSTTGLNRVYYWLTGDTNPGGFGDLDAARNIIFGDGLTSINYFLNRGNTGLTAVTFGSGCTSAEIGFGSDLVRVTSRATTAPSLSEIIFCGNNGILYYPTGSDYSSWLSLLDDYGWTGEQINI